ncbi:killer cell lectin-like receptor subfamily B member 1B allele B isoform X1 [Polypterus senegalus]|uniref:killer cell lectin-like receptor subfamily B member 1B allele B isoform X1 n=2 Tax=Polypterus senegalus TaxID=55291 RepID=UPI001963F62D|nr:killer cell lectin-like receptor subfamily B member 1B allele B isoform X1 [Polypterus senegalus]
MSDMEVYINTLYSELNIPFQQTDQTSKQRPEMRRRWSVCILIVIFVCLLLAAAAAIAVMALKTNPCPEWWVRYKDKCYYISTNKTTWNTSAEDCMSQGAQLIMMEDQEELELLRHQCRVHLSFWIGLRRKVDWKWIDGRAFNSTSSDLIGQGSCACLTGKKIQSLNCDQDLYWICKKWSSYM